MEDEHVCMANIELLPGCAYFGVFDGHGGAGAAHYVAQSLLPQIIEQVSAIDEAEGKELHNKLETALPLAFISTDDYMASHTTEYRQADDTEDPGSTAITAIITPTHFVFAHLGDARCVLDLVFSRTLLP